MSKLTIELVPQTCWFSNVRSEVTSSEWNRIKKAVFAKAGNICEVCGGKGNKWPVECHEIWEYDDINHIQTLLGMIALCPKCHSVKHFGYSESVGKGEIAFNHLMKVNGWSADIAEEYLKDQFELWRLRSQFKWTLDLSFLNVNFGIEIDS